MKKVLFALSILACAATAQAEDAAAVNCISFSPAGFCDAMQFDSNRRATWVNYDCGGSSGRQTTASYRRGKTTCSGPAGCNPSAMFGWDTLDWKFNKTNNTGTLTGVFGGVPQTLQQNMPVSITPGACPAARAGQGGVSSLAR